MKMKNLKIRQRALLSLHGGSLKITLTVPLSSILNSFHTIPLSKISTQLKHNVQEMLLFNFDKLFKGGA